MVRRRARILLFVLWIGSSLSALDRVRGGELTIELNRSRGVNFVGAVRRWDENGQPRQPVDPKAKIDAPRVDAKAAPEPGNRWVFHALPPGRYDVVILAEGRVRVEGFHYPPILEFDRPLPPNGPTPEEEVRDAILKDIGRARHFENKVTPLFLAGDDKQVRVLMQLVRDEPTSFDSELGKPAAVVRHEVWQYTNNYGGWVKERKTRILDRLLLPKAEFGRWTWVWEPRLGGIAVDDKAVRVSYEVPDRFEADSARGWIPN
jgi:hypothetical protein